MDKCCNCQSEDNLKNQFVQKIDKSYKEIFHELGRKYNYKFGNGHIDSDVFNSFKDSINNFGIEKAITEWSNMKRWKDAYLNSWNYHYDDDGW